ncbi:O-antigen ligase family protein [Haematomicrobium sanguinis]|uniref:O-antigen ligase family protein n=1 Tax=Haematomicrobium sanguinis TaxID=479106 RepID=UPI00047BFBB5|nr:O-antigen ligase family protein [Haematomicrobium sanguinis]
MSHPLPSTIHSARRIPRESWLLTLMFTILLVSVQPWVSAQEGSENALVGVAKVGAIVVVLILALTLLRARAPLGYAPAAMAYLLFAVFVILTAVFLDDSGSILVRALRLAAGIAAFVLMWPLYRSAPIRLVDALFFAQFLLGLSVVAGLVLAPGSAWRATGGTGGTGGTGEPGGRLMGVLLPMLPPRVAEIGAILVGLAVFYWAFRRFSAWFLAVAFILGVALMVLSKTRTPVAALAVALILGTLAVARTKGARRVFAVLGAAGIAALAALPALLTWLQRGQDPEMLSQLTGRTYVWNFILTRQYSPEELLLGQGLGSKRVTLLRGEGDVNQMAIDNTWLDAFWQTGIIGLILIILVFVAAWVTCLRAPRGLVRALAVFLMAYITVSSVSESGLTDFSSHSIYALVAVSAAAATRVGLPSSITTPLGREARPLQGVRP